MLKELIREYRQLRAPQGDGQTLVDPAWESLPEVVAQNRKRLAEFSYDLHGRSMAELSASARRNLLQFAVAFTSQYRGVPDDWRQGEALADRPLILSGHQPEMFHPGVWYKNFVLGGLARRMEGVGVHLLIDSDLCRTASIRVPTGSMEQPRVQAICYDKPAAEVPYEERKILDPAALRSFADRASAAIRPYVREPMVASLWPMAVERNAGQKNLGLRLAQARHSFEETWKNDTLELPQSAVCQLPEFAWFMAHLLARLPRFRAAYNESLALYRGAHRMRSRAHPVPDLASIDGWIEAPFWMWTAKDPQRRPMFARQTRTEVFISDRGAHTISLPLTADGEIMAAAEQLAALSSRGVKIRTRALSTTLFARLFLSDLFLHGIGGAKYDQVTDQIVRLFFGFEPPEFATVSATLRLPIDCNAADASRPGQWEHRLRELRYHPEHFVTCDSKRSGADPCPIGELIAAKRRWLAKPKTPQNARDRHLAITGANEALQSFVAPLREKIEQERRDILQNKRREAILRSREYSFCLYPRMHFDTLLAEPRL
jgi:hypothetical protein